MIEASLGNIAEPNNYSRDAFGRARISNPYTLFDSKLIGDEKALFWDTSGTGSISSAYNINRSSVTATTSAAASGSFIRQTYQRFNYQPGKSHLIMTTNVLGDPATGHIKRFGYFDSNNGVFFEQTINGLYAVIRSNRSGTPTDAKVHSSAWNIDTLDGTGESNKTLDTSKSNIYFFDMEWLGVGEVRFGAVIGGAPLYVHQAQHANKETGVYMTTPNLPLRYEIMHDGTGAAASIEVICNTVISEGGQEVTGITRSVSTGGTHLSASSADTVYAMLGIRLKSTHLDSVVRLLNYSVIAETNDDFEWSIILNPTIAGTFTYSDETNSAIQTAKGATANTVTGGTLLDCGFGKSGQASGGITDTIRYLGASIDGTRDTIVLCIRPLQNNAVLQGVLTWKESA